MVNRIFPLFFTKHSCWYSSSLTRISQSVLDETHVTWNSSECEPSSSAIHRVVLLKQIHTLLQVFISANLPRPNASVYFYIAWSESFLILFTSRQSTKCTFPFLGTAFLMLIMFFYNKSYFVTCDNWLDLDHCLFKYVPQKEPIFFKHSQKQATICFYCYTGKFKTPR